MARADHLDWKFIEAAQYRVGRVMPVTAGVDHFTAAGSGRALARWLSDKDDPSVKVSAHILLCRDGFIIQQVPFSSTAYHAGTRPGRGDLWQGQEPTTNVNNFTIGIENSNYGWLIKHQGAFYVPTKSGDKWMPGRRYPTSLPEPIQAPDHHGQERWWEPYSDEIVEANVSVKKRARDMGLVMKRENWVGHSDVSPNRKTDPGPMWPKEYILDQVFGTGILTNVYVVQGGADPNEDSQDAVDFRRRYDENIGICLEDEEKL